MSGKTKSGFDSDAIHFIAREINDAIKGTRTQIAIVMGGGNIIRGSKLVKELGTTPVIGDQAGMLATVVNAIILQDFLEHIYGLAVRVLSSVEVRAFAEPYIRRRAMQHLHKKRVVILAGGTGDTRFTTDTAAVLRAIELEARVMIKGTKVDGIYDRDPYTEKNAKFIEKIDYKDFTQRGLKIVDRTAVTLAGENYMPIHIFDIFKNGNLKKILTSKKLGSVIVPEQ